MGGGFWLVASIALICAAICIVYPCFMALVWVVLRADGYKVSFKKFMQDI